VFHLKPAYARFVATIRRRAPFFFLPTKFADSGNRTSRYSIKRAESWFGPVGRNIRLSSLGVGDPDRVRKFEMRDRRQAGGATSDRGASSQS
jgi:hypothetical protein